MVARALHDNAGIQQVIIGPDVALEQACELAEAARLDRPELGVILLRHRVDVTALVPGPAQRGPRGRPRRRPHRPRRGLRRSRDLTARLVGHARGGAGHGGQGRHGLLGQGRRRQDDALDQPRRPTSPAPAPRPSSSTSTSPSATSRSACSCARQVDLSTPSPMSGHLDEQGDRLVRDHAPGRAAWTSSAPRTTRATPTASRSTRHRADQGGPAALRLRHHRHPAVVHRARARGLRLSRRARPHRHARHPGREEPAGGPRHARPARQPEGRAGHRAQPRRRQGRPATRRRRHRDQDADRGHHPELAHACRPRSTAASRSSSTTQAAR